MHDRLPVPDDAERAHAARMLAHLRTLLTTRGSLPFAQYMHECLYAPGLGYYSAGRTKFGAAGDFVTAPELGGLFAHGVAQALTPLLEACGEAADMLELGAGSGAFAVDALRALESLGRAPRRYLILETSADLRARQRERVAAQLPPALAARVTWLDAPPTEPWRGVLFANEVIDALPATRFVVRDEEVFEEHVALDAAGQLLRVDRPADAMLAAQVRGVESALGHPFADGQRGELHAPLPAWLAAVAGTLQTGALLFVDYGDARAAYYHPARRDGTLMAHYRHRALADPLFLPGLCDLTASVDFSALAEAGAQAGFALGGWWTQATFLLAAGLPALFESAFESAPDAAAQLRLAEQVRRLTLPDQMGERFHAMLLLRGLETQVVPAALREADQRERL